MAGATSHKLGVGLMIIWVGDVGGTEGRERQRVGRSHPDLTIKPNPAQTLIPDLWQQNGEAYQLQQSADLPTVGEKCPLSPREKVCNLRGKPHSRADPHTHEPPSWSASSLHLLHPLHHRHNKGWSWLTVEQHTSVTVQEQTNVPTTWTDY